MDRSIALMDSIALPKIHVFPFSQSINPISLRSVKILQPKFSPFALNSLRSFRRPASATCSAILYGSSGGGGGDDLAGGGGGGGDGEGRGDAESRSIAVGESNEVPNLGKDDDLIILSVGGMACGGCAASVKRILESQSQVSLADVNFEKETALVWVVPEVKTTQNWQQELGEMLANHLTTCGFKSELRGNV